MPPDSAHRLVACRCPAKVFVPKMEQSHFFLLNRSVRAVLFAPSLHRTRGTSELDSSGGDVGTLRVCLFGRFTLQRDAKVMLSLHPHKVQELFCYLLLERHRIHAREAIAAIFWGECTTSQSRKYLRQGLWQLQKILNRGIKKSYGRILRVDADYVSVNPDGELWLDAAVFEETYRLFQALPGPELNEKQANALSEAVQLYRGDLLEGCHEDWCLSPRERLQTLYISVLEKLMCYSEARGLYRAGLEYGERILRADRAHERTHQRMLRLFYLSGDRAGAVRQYQRCMAALEEELGVPPAQRTRDLYAQIRADRLNDTTASLIPEGRAEPLTRLGCKRLTEVLSNLRRTEATLSCAQQQLQGNIDLVKGLLDQHRASPIAVRKIAS
jgi:DNA-binding SARP family transcriptional activator